MGALAKAPIRESACLEADKPMLGKVNPHHPPHPAFGTELARGPRIMRSSCRSVVDAAPWREPETADGQSNVVRTVYEPRIAQPVSPMAAHVDSKALDGVAARGHRILADCHSRVRHPLEQLRRAPHVLAKLRQGRKPLRTFPATRRRLGIAAAEHLPSRCCRVDVDDILFPSMRRERHRFVRRTAPRHRQRPEHDTVVSGARLQGEHRASSSPSGIPNSRSRNACPNGISASSPAPIRRHQKVCS